VAPDVGGKLRIVAQHFFEGVFEERVGGLRRGYLRGKKEKQETTKTHEL